MRQVWDGVKFAVSYFSALPVRFSSEADLTHPRVLESMVLSMPMVGVLLAGLTLGVWYLLGSIGWAGAVIAALIYPVMYGFLHTEAVMDVADALYAAHSGKDPYTIIKDPTVGAMGVFYGVTILLIKTALITSLLLAGHGIALIEAALISRMGLVVLFHLHTFRSSFVEQLRQALDGRNTLIVLGIYTLVGLIFLPAFWLWLGVGLAAAIAISYALRSRLGFVNGDVLGATLEGVEVVVLILLSFRIS